MQSSQSLRDMTARVVASIDGYLDENTPDMIMVQGLEVLALIIEKKV